MDVTSRIFSTIVITALLTSSTNAQFGFLGSIFSSDEEIAVPVTTPAPPVHSDDGCVCKPFNQCPTYESDEDGVNQIDIRNNFGPCPSYLEVCCNETSSTGQGEKNNGNSGYNTNSNNNFNTNSGSYGQGENNNNNYNNNNNNNDNNNNNNNNNDNNNQHTNGGYSTSSPNTYETNRDTQTCGIWNKNGVGFRITNAINSESQYAEYPSMIAIFREENPLFGEKKLFYHCGGSLIKPNVVLTSAHCVIQKEPSSIVLRAGEWDLQTEKEIYMHQDRHARKIITHPKYYAGGLHNDIALVFTDEAFLLQETVKTICLPKQNQNFDRAYCYSSGWGKEIFTNNYTITQTTDAGTTNIVGHYQVSILKKVELPIVEKNACEDALRSTRLGPKFRLHESFICAGGEEGKDTCKGDGGSPLMCPSEEDSNHLVQAGIVAWGVGCGIYKIPAAYVNVAHFRDWIDDEISANSYLTSSDKEMSVVNPTSQLEVNNEQGCTCKPFNQCPTFVSDEDGLNQIDIRNNFGPCPSYLDVCCNETSPGQHEKNTIITGSNTNNNLNSNYDGLHGSNNNYGNREYNNSNTFSYGQSTSSTNKYEIINDQERCGNWNKKGLGFKVVNAINGESQYAEFPSMIAIFREEITNSGEKNLFYNCGGSLITQRVVLTAAHCVFQKEPSTIVARAGDWDLQTEKEIYLHQNRYARKIVIHENYYAPGLHNDIALLFLNEPFTLQDTVKTMCLPKQNQIFDHSFCFSSGWGKEVSFNSYTIIRKTKEGTINDIGKYQVSILKKVELPIIPSDICEEALRTTRLGLKFKLHKSFICAGGEKGADTCRGDGGSPLMCPSEEDPNYLVQAGIVSWGISCGVHKVPAAYVNVAHFRDWIDSKIKTNSEF